MPLAYNMKRIEKQVIFSEFKHDVYADGKR